MPIPWGIEEKEGGGRRRTSEEEQEVGILCGSVSIHPANHAE